MKSDRKMSAAVSGPEGSDQIPLPLSVRAPNPHPYPCPVCDLRPLCLLDVAMPSPMPLADDHE